MDQQITNFTYYSSNVRTVLDNYIKIFSWFRTCRTNVMVYKLNPEIK